MIHHIALATKDIAQAHHFYSEVMGFQLVKAVFYDTGDGALFALWDLRGLEGEALKPETWRAGLSTAMGLPNWVNHIAFECKDAEDFARRTKRWLDHGYHVSEVDHDFITSAYTIDPDGTMVEWTYRTEALTEADRKEALTILQDDSPATEEDYRGTFTRASAPKSRASVAA